MGSPLKLIAVVLAVSAGVASSVFATTKLATNVFDRETSDASYIVLSEAETASAHVHTPVVDAPVAATCTTPGLTEGSHCAECGAVIVAQAEIPALGHDILFEELAYETEEGEEEVVIRVTFLCGHAEDSIIELEDADGEIIELLDTVVEGDKIIARISPKSTGVTKVRVKDSNGSVSDQSASVVVHSKDRERLPEGTTVITAGMFDGCQAEEIVIPEGVTHIEENAFANCPNLKIVILPDSLVEISPKAFEKVEGVTIVCSENSVGAKFAGENNVNLVPCETEAKNEYSEPAAEETKKKDRQSAPSVTQAPACPTVPPVENIEEEITQLPTPQPTVEEECATAAPPVAVTTNTPAPDPTAKPESGSSSSDTGDTGSANPPANDVVVDEAPSSDSGSGSSSDTSSSASETTSSIQEDIIFESVVE